MFQGNLQAFHLPISSRPIIGKPIFLPTGKLVRNHCGCALSFPWLLWKVSCHFYQFSFSGLSLQKSIANLWIFS